MILRLIKNEIKNQKLLSTSTVIFMAVSSMLIVLSITLFSTLLSSVSSLMDEAVSPDFLQMHSGEIDEDEIREFAEGQGFEEGQGCEEDQGFAEDQELVKGQGVVEKWQVYRFLNLDNNEVTLGDESLVGNTQDNGFCVQGVGFDFLLDMENQQPEVKAGEVYVPVCYKSLYELSVGDEMRVGDESLTIAGFIRDSQMNSMMASSKRFLVSAEDYERLVYLGSEEYLIEFLLCEGADLDAFATEYAKAGLPDNGPAITKPLIKLMNALSDGIMIFVIFLVGIAILLISLLCISYITSLGVERDRREAGTLKALGIGRKQIRRIYISKYVFFAVIGGGAGFVGALLLARPLGRSLKELYGTAANGAATTIASLLICIMIQGLILLFIRRIIKRNDKITALEALLDRQNMGRKSGRGQMVIIGLVTALCMMLALIPQNLFTTLKAPEFVSYMGIGNAELRMDIRQSKDIENDTKKVVERLEGDELVKEFVALKTVSCPAVVEGVEGVGGVEGVDGVGGDCGEEIRLLVEVGDHNVFPVAYTEGKAPADAGEIALSVLQAQDLGIGVGDKILIKAGADASEGAVQGADEGESKLAVQGADGGESRETAGNDSTTWDEGDTDALDERDFSEQEAGVEVIVCGLYSDITNGGKTAKMAVLPQGVGTEKIMWSVLYITLNDPAQRAEWIKGYEGSGDIVDIADYVNATYGPTINQVGKAKVIALLIAMGILFVVVVLFVRLLIEKSRREISLKKALGFRGRNIQWQYIRKASLPVIVGVGAGAFLSVLMGEGICGLALSSLGASGFHFVISGAMVALLIISLMATGFVALLVGTGETTKIRAYECCRGKE